MPQLDDLLAVATRTQQSVNAIAGTVSQVSTDIQTAIGLLQQNGGGDNPQIAQAISTLSAAADSLDAAAATLGASDTALQGAENPTPPGGGVQAASHASATRPGSAASVA